jgi:hypothetical protein
MLFCVDIILKISLASKRYLTGLNINQKCPALLNSQSLLLMVPNVLFSLDGYGITNEYNDLQDRVLSQVRDTKYIPNVEHLSTHLSD